MSSIVIDRLDGLSSTVAYKGPCRLASTVNVVRNGLKIIGGVQTKLGDRVLLTGQTNPIDNGIYIVDTGNWRRARDFNKTGDAVRGTRVWVTDGGGPIELQVISPNPIRIGQDAILFEDTDYAGAANSAALRAEAAAAAAMSYAPVSIVVPAGRLTLSPTTPITSADINSSASIHYLPVAGSRLPVFDGTIFTLNDIGSGGLTLALDGVSGHVGYHQQFKPFDLFAIVDDDTLRLVTGPSWMAGAVAGSLATRGTGAGSTELENHEGLLVNKNAMTVRFGTGSGDTLTVPAREATYLGSFLPNADGTAVDTKTNRWLFNAYNQGMRVLRRAEPTTIWNYLTYAFQVANNNSQNVVSVFLGLAGPVVDISVKASVINNTSTIRAVAIGISKDGLSIDPNCIASQVGVTNYHVSLEAHYCDAPGMGFHVFYWMERGAGADVQTWTGTDIFTNNGIFGKVFA